MAPSLGASNSSAVQCADFLPDAPRVPAEPGRHEDTSDISGYRSEISTSFWLRFCDKQWFEPGPELGEVRLYPVA